MRKNVPGRPPSAPDQLRQAAARDVAVREQAAGLPALLASLHDHGVSGLFGVRVGQDPKHSDWQILSVGPGGLGLPDRDYYFRTDSASVETRARYVAHVAKAFELVGTPWADAKVKADRILALETALAGASLTNVQRRDPRAVYHKMSAAAFESSAPRFGWDAYLAARGLAKLDSVNVTQPGYVRAVDSLVAAVPLEDWRAYLSWRVVDHAAPALSRAFVDEDFRFDQVLSGIEQSPPRWKRCVRAADNDLGDLLGKAYVQGAPCWPRAERQGLPLVRNPGRARRDRITALEWMGPETRTKAIEKLKAFENKIGYPNTWRDYAGVKLTRTSYYANRQNATAYESRRNLAKLGKPVDRGEWNMSAPTVNAFYSSSLNSINFPAGILQPPFFGANSDDAMNYGAIGTVIGHEMTHGFDDRGRQFDAAGNLRDWWTADDASRYKERADKVAAQFSGYTVLDTLHVNGRLTLGENIADLGGVAVAWAALNKALENQRVAAIDGLSPHERFFYSYAQIWREVTRDASLRTLVLTNPHSPPVWRVNGPLSNLPEFAETFGCKAGDGMVRAEELRARIW